MATEPEAQTANDIAPDFARALSAGTLWALAAALTSHVAISALPALLVGASWTQLLCLFTWSTLSSQPGVLGAAGTPALGRPALAVGDVGLGAALLGGWALVVGQVLKDNTHHRPLAAVAWVMLVAAALPLTAAIVRRLKPNAVVGALAAAVFSLGCAWLGRDALLGTTSLHLLAGAVGLALALLHRARFPVAGRRLAWPVAALLVAGTAWCVSTGQGQQAVELAPLPLGLVGLI